MDSVIIDLFGWQINFDWSWVYTLGEQPLNVIIWHFVVNGGWLMFVATFIFGGWINYVYLRQRQFAARQSYVFLAIDIPKENLQTPRAVENIFTALAGAQTPLDWHEKYLFGEYQLGFSLEIVSIDGYIQFLIRTPVQYRNLVEASIYSQYPEAEITQVNDYTADINVHFPSDEYNLWGADMVLTNEEYFPIRTYLSFQEEMDKEFKDPIAATLEVMSSIGPGEQIWLQLMIVPADIGWEKSGLKATNKVLGIEEKVKRTALDKITDAPLKALELVGDELFGATVVKKEEKKAEKMNMMFLPPREKQQVEAILTKIEKTCFKCKLRLMYFGKREVFKKGLGVSGMIGAIKQFGSTALNGFKPGKNKTQAKLFFKKPRMATKQNKILEDYKGRNPDTCNGKYLLNVEELATLFHFPYIEVKAPMVKKIESRRAQSPIGLPVEIKGKIVEDDAVESVPAGSKPGEVVPVVDYDTDYFEKRFAVDKTGQSDKKRKKQITEELVKTGKIKPGKAIKENEKKAEAAAVEDESPVSVDNKIEEDSDTPANLPFVD